MKNFLHSRDGASKGAALMIVLALVVLLTGLALAYMSRTTTDRQLAQSSYNDTSADLLARSALDVVVGNFKQELLSPAASPVTRSNIQPQRSGDDASIPNLIRRSVHDDPIPAPGVSSLASIVSSSDLSANGRSITAARWNSHYLIPPVSSFVAPDWVMVTAQGPAQAPDPATVIGRYAFAVYDEGGLLDMNLAGYPPNWLDPTCAAVPSPTPWLVNVGRKGILAFADLTALGLDAPQINNIVGWRNYATTQRTASFGSFNFPAECNSDVPSHAKQDIYGSYLLYFGDPPFRINSLSDKLLASTYPFTAVANYVSTLSGTSRTDQRFMTRQELLRLQRSIGFSQNVLQYMGTFSRERNRPAPDWPGLNPGGALSAGRFNLNNLAIVIPNPADCHLAHGRKVGWQTGKNKNHLCGDSTDIHDLFGLFWVKSEVVTPCSDPTCPGEWRYIGNAGLLPPDPNANPTPKPGIDCLSGGNLQNDFFQILHCALFGSDCAPGRDANLDKTFAIGASLIDQYDSATYDSVSGTGCPPSGPNSSHTQPPGCDLDAHAVGSNWNTQTYATHTTAILYGRGNGNAIHAYGMEPNYSANPVNGDEPYDHSFSGKHPHRPSPAPAPPTTPNTFMNHSFSNVGELGYGIYTNLGAPSPPPASTPLPTLDFSSPSYPDAGVLDFFSYNPISSAYPRAGIVNLYTKNAPVLAAILAQTLKTDAAANSNPPSPVVSASEATTAASAIVTETKNVLAGSPGYGPVTRTDLTRAIAARLAAAGGSAIGTTTEQKEAIARALAEVGQTRTWNLLIDVIAQTGKYKPNSDLTGSNFVVEGEKRYWLHIALGRDLINADGTPCTGSGCQVDVLGTQLEEVTE